MNPATIFVTYNPRNDFEQTLAIRLQTLGAIHGFNMLLPDRFGGKPLVTQETEYRIKTSDYFVLFSTSPLTPVVQNEIEVAYQHLKDKSRIIIVYDRVKNLHHSLNCTEVYIDSSKSDAQEILQQTISSIQENQAKKGKKDAQNALGAFLLIGLGLLALNSATSK
jgi:hypothetical protein